MIRVTSRNAAVHMSLEKDGYAVIPSFFSSVQMTELAEFFSQTVAESQVDVPFFTTHWSPDISYRQKINDFVKQISKENLDLHFADYKNLLGYFLFKKHSAEGGVYMHKDWTLIDEDKFVGYTLWMPLVDTTLENGCFQVVPASHTRHIHPRGSFIPQNYTDVQESDFMPLPVQAGDAIIFDHRLLHASPPNLSHVDRLSVGLIIVPPGASSVHYIQDPDGLITTVDVGDDFLVKSFYDYKKTKSPDYILDIIKSNWQEK